MASMTNPIRRFFKGAGKKSSLPEYIDVYKTGRVPVVQEDLVDEQWGVYDPKRNRIVINKRIPEVAKHMVLVHQMLELTKGLLATDHLPTFVQASPILMLHLMTEAGVYNGVTAEEVVQYIINEEDLLAERKDA